MEVFEVPITEAYELLRI